MNGFYLLRASIRMATGHISHFAASFLMIGALATSSLATPITFAFDAVVGPPRQGVDGFVPPSPGVSLQPGDTVSGSFTFEPVSAPSGVFETKAVESFPFAINIKSQTLVSSHFSIDALDNVHAVGDSMGDGILDYDSIVFGCSFNGGGTVCSPSSVSPSDSTIWASTIALHGDTSVLDGPDIPSNPATWRRPAPSSTMILSLDDEVHSKFYGFSADVISFRQVPEPSTHRLLLSLAAAVLLQRAVRRGSGFRRCAMTMVAVACASVASVSGASTYRVDLTDITTDANPDANYLQAKFDFGTTFRSIDSVSLVLTLPTGYGSSGGTVDYEYDSYLRVLVHQEGFDLTPHVPDDQPIIGAPLLTLLDTQFAEQDYERIQPKAPKTIELHPYIKGCWPGCTITPGQVLEYYWPPFFNSGKGVVTLQGYSSVGYQFGNLSGIYSSMGYTKPPAVTQATLIIEATPTPETSSMSLMLIGAVVFASVHLWKLPRMRQREDVPRVCSSGAKSWCAVRKESTGRASGTRARKKMSGWEA